MRQDRGNEKHTWLLIVLIIPGLLFFGCLDDKDGECIDGEHSPENCLESEEKQKILNVSTMDVPPFGFFSETGEPTGILVDFADYLGETLNLEVRHRVVPFSRCMSDLETGEADLWLGFDNKFVKESSVRAAKFLPVNTVVIGAPGISFNSFEDLHSRTIATIQDAQYNPLFSEDESILKYPTQNYEQNIHMLLRGRVDGMIGPDIGLYYTLREMGQKRSDFGDPFYLEARMSYIFFSKKRLDPEILKQIKALSETREYKEKIKFIISSYID